MITFVALQWMDFLTTILGFALGASEASPIVNAFGHVTTPVLGLLVSKVLVVLAMFRLSKIGWALPVGNAWYGLIIVWNLGVLSFLG